MLKSHEIERLGFERLGVQRLGVVCVNGSKGFPVLRRPTDTFPTAVLSCMGRFVGNGTRCLSTKHRKKFLSDIRAVCYYVSIGKSLKLTCRIEETRGKQYRLLSGYGTTFLSAFRDFLRTPRGHERHSMPHRHVRELHFSAAQDSFPE